MNYASEVMVRWIATCRREQTVALSAGAWKKKCYIAEADNEARRLIDVPSRNVALAFGLDTTTGGASSLPEKT